MQAAISIKKSPNLFSNKALTEALTAFFLVDQKPINKKERKPIPSQPRNRIMILLEVIKTVIKKVNKAR